LIDVAMDTVSFSIDGLKEEFERIRAPGKYEDIIEQVANLHAMRGRAGGKKPIIRIQSVMLNDKDQREFLDIWEPISDDIFFLQFKNYAADAENIQKRNYACPMPVQRLMVHWNGTVPMCINDEYEDAVMGSLNEQTVRDIWRGETFRQARKTHLNGERTLVYKNCAKCPLTRAGHGEG
jgi:radical SAM protein with 4Fe4S-binding SPASM domain